MKTYDLIVIGAGGGGLMGARFAAWLGASVLLVEKARLGGDCLFTGCVPSKALIRSAEVAHLMRRADAFGISSVAPSVDMTRVSANVQGVIDRVAEQDRREDLEQSGIDVVFGAARFESPAAVSVQGETFHGRRFLVATGSRPLVPPLEGLAEVPCWTTDTIWEATTLPEALLVVGGGPVAVELGQAFARLGSKVTLVEKLPRLLPQEDAAVSETVQEALADEGVTILTSTEVRALRREAAGFVVEAKGPAEDVALICSDVLLAAGRKPNVEDLNLEAAGVAYDRRGIGVDKTLRTSARSIYACGDATGAPFLTHLAGYEGAMAARNALLPLRQKAKTAVLPMAIFCDPGGGPCRPDGGGGARAAARRDRDERPPRERGQGPDGAFDARLHQGREQEERDDPRRPHRRPARLRGDPGVRLRDGDEAALLGLGAPDPRLPDARDGQPAGRLRVHARPLVPQRRRRPPPSLLSDPRG